MKSKNLIFLSAGLSFAFLTGQPSFAVETSQSPVSNQATTLQTQQPANTLIDLDHDGSVGCSDGTSASISCGLFQSVYCLCQDADDNGNSADAFCQCL